jgi:hypothetical protein
MAFRESKLASVGDSVLSQKLISAYSEEIPYGPLVYFVHMVHESAEKCLIIDMN